MTAPSRKEIGKALLRTADEVDDEADRLEMFVKCLHSYTGIGKNR